MIKRSLVKALFLMMGIFLFAGHQAQACDIKFKVLGEKKETYKVGDEIVIKIEVHYTHRICPEAIEDTKFTYNGIEVKGATKWQETQTNLWTRKLKVKVKGTKDGKLIINASRTCDKVGGVGTLTLDSTPLKEKED